MNKNLKILLVEPQNEEILTGSGGTAPLWPGVLAALTPPNHRVDFVQCSFEKIDEKKICEYDLVGVSSRTDTAKHAYKIGDMCKRVGVPCVMGGIHPFVSTEETKRHCDSIVLGEAENIWPTVVNDAQANTLRYIYRGERPNPEQLCSPDLSVTNKYRYSIENIVETVRGCPYNCSFCIKYDYKTIIKKLHDHNIDVFGNFIFGLDEDTPDVFKKTVDFVFESGVDFPVFQLLVPYPGTVVFDEMKAQDRILTEDWSKYTRSDVVYKPAKLTSRQLVDGLFWAYQEAYSNRALLKHFLTRWRGVKKSMYNVKILSHFSKQIENVKEYHSRKVEASGDLFNHFDQEEQHAHGVTTN